MVTLSENASITLKGLAVASASEEGPRQPPAGTSSDRKPSYGSTPEPQETSPPTLSSSEDGEGRSTGNRSCPPEPCCGHVRRPRADPPETEGTERASRLGLSLRGKLRRTLKCRY